MKVTSDTFSIPTILNVGKGNLAQIGSLVAETGYSNVVLFFGSGIYDLIGELVGTSFQQAKIKILHQYEHDDNQMDCLMNFAFSIPAETELAEFYISVRQISGVKKSNNLSNST